MCDAPAGSSFNFGPWLQFYRSVPYHKAEQYQSDRELATDYKKRPGHRPTNQCRSEIVRDNLQVVSYKVKTQTSKSSLTKLSSSARTRINSRHGPAPNHDLDPYPYLGTDAYERQTRVCNLDVELV